MRFRAPWTGLHRVGGGRHPDLVDRVILANSLHSPEMWQAKHVNINLEIARQDPDWWERIQALRAQGLPSTHPDLQAEYAAAQPLVRFFNPENAGQVPHEPGSRNTELCPIFCGVRFRPDATLIWLERSGAFAHIEEPETITAHVRDFLA